MVSAAIMTASVIFHSTYWHIYRASIRMIIREQLSFTRIKRYLKRTRATLRDIL
ncbi:hypothetical protein BJV82DRAFT_595157, partial [Fennellomyces sp. T-0311]